MQTVAELQREVVRVAEQGGDVVQVAIAPLQELFQRQVKLFEACKASQQLFAHFEGSGQVFPAKFMIDNAISYVENQWPPSGHELYQAADPQLLYSAKRVGFAWIGLEAYDPGDTIHSKQWAELKDAVFHLRQTVANIEGRLN